MKPLIVIPARNEATTLPAVVDEVRRCAPGLDLLVIDDASEDGTVDVLPRLDVRTIRLHECLGPGGAVRCGLRYARSLDYDAVVRLDADGQHAAAAIPDLLVALETSDADAVVACRTDAQDAEAPLARRLARQGLASALGTLTGTPVSDPTSGFWAFGPRAIELLFLEHPTGYGEPLLRLLLHRHGLRVIEHAVPIRARAGGRTSITPTRAALFVAHVAWELGVAPLRRSFVAEPRPRDGNRPRPWWRPRSSD